MPKTAEIKLKVTLDDEKLPEKIEWMASESQTGIRDAQAMMLSLWDAEEKNTYSIDLWTKSMMVNDMNIFYYQMFQKMAETYRNSTRDEETYNKLITFATEFAKEKGLI